MNKKAQTILIIIMAISVVTVVTLIVILLKPSTTGNIVNKNVFIEESCSISLPFICKESSIATRNKVILFIRNEGNEDILIKKIMLTNCLETAKDFTYGIETKGILFNKDNEEFIILDCDKELENTFKGDIEITYGIAGEPVESKATGSIIKNVM